MAFGLRVFDGLRHAVSYPQLAQLCLSSLNQVVAGEVVWKARGDTILVSQGDILRVFTTRII